MSKIKNNLCSRCSGRGFDWDADYYNLGMYRQGDDCRECGGSGLVGLDFQTKALFVSVGVLLSIFVILPLIRLWLD